LTDEELEKAALDAIYSAADRIADFLQALGRAEALELDKKQSVDLSSRYLAFLEEENRLRAQGGSGDGAANGG
jgi:hypothetical protein